MARHNSVSEGEKIIFFIGCFAVIPLSVFFPYLTSIIYTTSFIGCSLGYFTYRKPIRKCMFSLFDKIAECFGYPAPMEIDEDVLDRIREVDNSVIQRQLGIPAEVISATNQREYDLPIDIMQTAANELNFEVINELFQDIQQRPQSTNSLSNRRTLCG